MVDRGPRISDGFRELEEIIIEAASLLRIQHVAYLVYVAQFAHAVVHFYK